MATPAEVMRNRSFAVVTVDPRERAVASFRETRRRRRARGAIDTAVDAVMATGGIIVANAALHLNVGLPEGRNGLALGGALLAAGMAWITRKVRGVTDPSDPAASQAQPLYHRIDAAAQRAAA